MQKQHFLSILTNEIGLRRTALVKLIFLATAIILCGTIDSAAQKKRTNKRTNTVAKNVQPNKVEKSDTNGTTNSTIPVSVVNAAETDFLSGEASVTVNPKQPTVVRLGLAQNSVSIVEFPASDGIYYIHEGVKENVCTVN